jgi:protein involved in polysaccharide export with SLBB domain
MMPKAGWIAGRALAALAALLVVAPPLAAQVTTAEQMQLFQELTPEQQQAVLDRLTSGGDTANDTGVEPAAASATRNGRSTERPARQQAIVAEPEDPVLTARDFVTLDVSVPATAPAGDRTRLETITSLILSRNPYTLDRGAQLNLPGFAPIRLGGLNEMQATRLLALEPALAGLKVKLVRVPLDKEQLKPFGYEFFRDASSALPARADTPVPADYIVGTGDAFTIQLFGNQNRNLRLTVNRDGVISFPELGPIRVSGMTSAEARRAIESRVQSQLIGVRASVSMGDARAIGVFVLGEARQPGSYTVNGLATITTALFASGGINDIGSLRDIQLKRLGETVRHLDLYDLLIGGDTSNDAKLLPGDVIFVPPVGPTVSVDGEVRRPAIYELRADSSVADLVRIAGGLTPEADGSRTSLTRIDANNRRVVLNVNLGDPGLRAQAMRNGDSLHVAALRPQLDAGVTLGGFVYRPGLFEWHAGMRLTDVLNSIEELKPGADQRYVLIRREVGADRRVQLLSADLTAALASKGSAADPELSARDRIFVFDLAPGRDRIIQPLLDELELQSDLGHPTEIVSVKGRVKAPGEYPLEPGMRVADLLRAGGNLEPEAYRTTAELTRYRISASGTREAELLTVDIPAVLRGDASMNFELRPFDYLLVQETPEWGEQQMVVLRGEVRLPGSYPIRKGETLLEVLARAGGLSAQAFPEGTVFTRTDLKVLEQQQLDRLANSMRGDLVTLSMQAARGGQANAGETLLAGQSLLSQLQSAKATGRFVIDLPGLLTADIHSEKDVLLRDGDELFIPKRRQEVTVIGEVQNSSTHLYQRKLARADYIGMSGGVTRRADKARAYVVRADGSVATDKAIKAGDTIVVPVDTERMPRLPFWQAVTQILYNVAVSVAAVNSF